MSYIARRNHHRGGNRNPQDFQRRKNAALVVGHGDIFSSESPKAYSPLGYSLPDQPTVLKPEDFNNDTPLPACPQRPPFYVSKPLGATFVDTELQKPNFSGPHRLVPSRDNANSTPVDPATKIVASHAQQKRDLTLGKNVISETGLENGTVYLEKILKRERETTTEPEDNKEVKKQKKDLMAEVEVNEDTVRPENVLRMVDSSLVDTPEKKGATGEAQPYHSSPNRSDSREGSAPYTQSSRTRPIGSERRYDYDRRSGSSQSFRDDYMMYDDYRPSQAPSQAPPIPYYNKRERRESNDSTAASGSRYPPSGSGYYEDYQDYRYRGTGSSGNDSYYDERYEDKRYYGGNGRYGGNVPPIEPPRGRKNSRDYDYEEYRRRNNPSTSSNGRRYDNRRRY